ncbi:MAG: LysE family translocator [Chloroflexales bacterium]|nr:LysE family translocator [Chloroflexales bacterium]
MPDATRLGLFIAAALLLAITPGPGIFYVLTRSLKGGRAEGLASSFGTALGSFAHVLAAALGLSALLATSATAFAIIKYVGAAYLVYLGWRTLRQPDTLLLDSAARSRQTWRAFTQGITTEILNPKTALFFLAFIPQFVDPQQPIVSQFIVLGSIAVLLNTSADVVVALVAGPIGHWLHANARFRRRQRRVTGWALIGLGAYVAVAENGK